MSNESDDEAAFTTGYGALYQSGDLDCGESGTSWADLCDESETQWVIAAHDRIEDVGYFEGLGLVAVSCELSLDFSGGPRGVAVSFVVE